MLPTQYLKPLASALLLGALVGCAGTPNYGPAEGAPVTDVDDTGDGTYSAVEYFGGGNGGAAGSGGANTGIAHQGGIPEGEEFEEQEGYAADQPPANALEVRTIYFDYDSSEIRADYRDVVLTHGMALAANPNLSVTVEGHCDERGSREYNIALGERRANSIKRILMAQGAQENQIVTISYGEERPAVLGSNEQAWGRNRRAELVY